MEYHNIDGVDIPFDNNWKNIAVSLSGGADSALLAYILCELIGDKDIHLHIISHIRMWKTRPWQEYDSLRIFKYLHNKFDINMTRYTNFIAPDLEYGNIGPIIKDEYNKMVSGDNIQIRSYSEYICQKYNVDAYYNAVTRNPKNVDFVGMIERDIDPTVDNKHLCEMIHMGKYALHPFRFVQKDWVVKQYKDKDIMDLFKQTRSCEGEFVDINYTNYIPYQHVPTCNECFWCKERNWAIERNK